MNNNNLPKFMETLEAQTILSQQNITIVSNKIKILSQTEISSI